MDFYSIIVVVAVVIAAYLVWSRFFKAKPAADESCCAPYKVETPAPVSETPAPVAATVAPAVAPVAETAKAPELKVVTGQPKQAAKKPAAKKSTAKPAAKKPAAKKPAQRKPAAKKPVAPAK